MSRSRSGRYSISPLEALVMIHNVAYSEDAGNDADRTTSELIQELDAFDGFISKAILESALYCCNLENEKKKFWHPLEQSFKHFLNGVLPRDQCFDTYYNVVHDKKEDRDGLDDKTRR